MASFMPAGEEYYDEDDFMLGNDDMETGNSVNMNTNNQSGFQPPCKSQEKFKSIDDLQQGTMKGQIDIIEACLHQGIKVDAILRCGWTALMYAASIANPAIVNLLLKKGADPNFHNDFYTVLMSACSTSRKTDESVVKCVCALLDAGADVNSRDRYHMTALMCASREGHISIVKHLLDLNAAMDRQDSRGWTALSWACSKGRIDVIKYLLDKGADKSLKHIDGFCAVDNATASQNDEIVCLMEGKLYEKSAPSSAGVVEKFLMASSSNLRSTHTTTASPILSGNSKPPMAEGDMIPVDKPTDQQYGEVEVFLFGLDLGQLIPLFRDQHVDFFNFLRFNENDLINMGVSQIGARKKILDAIAVVHKKEWDTSSLISVQYNKHIGCPDAMAMIANISKHLCYIGSTVGYVADSIRHHPQVLADVRDGSGPRQLHKHTHDALKNVEALRKEIVQLEEQLNREMKILNLNAPDVIKIDSGQKFMKYSLVSQIVAVSMAVSIATIVWWKRGEVVSLFVR